MVTERTDNSSGPDLDTDPGLDPETGRRPTVAIVAVLALCGTAVALQQTMVVPLLPEFPTILGVSADDASWLVTATLLTSAVATR